MRCRAAILLARDEPLVIDEIDLPDPRPDQVVVKLFASGVCHTQLHQMHHRPVDQPTLLGHEGSGVVAMVGRDIHHLKEGDHAMVTWLHRSQGSGPRDGPPTGASYRGRQLGEKSAVFTWSDYTLTAGDHAIRMRPDDPTDVSCVVGCALATGAGAVLNTAQVRPGASVAVFGAGGVGLAAIRAAAILEASPIIAVDLSEEKLAFASEWGATDTVDASTDDAVTAIREMTDGGVAYAFDTIGARATTEQILSATRAGGSGAGNEGGMAILVGVPTEEMTLDPRLFLAQRQYRGSLGASDPERDFPRYLSWHRQGKFPLDRLITKRYRLDDINEACDALAAGEILGRAMVEF